MLLYSSVTVLSNVVELCWFELQDELLPDNSIFICLPKKLLNMRIYDIRRIAQKKGRRTYCSPTLIVLFLLDPPAVLVHCRCCCKLLYLFCTDGTLIYSQLIHHAFERGVPPIHSQTEGSCIVEKDVREA